MHLQVVKVGQAKFPEYDAAVARLSQRAVPLARSAQGAKLSSVTVKGSQTGDAKKDDKLLRQLDKLLFTGPGHLVWLLDEDGTMLSSPAFAHKLSASFADPAIKQLSLVVGGPYGLPESFRARCHGTIALSPMIFTSDLAWLIVWEQLYRGLSIITGSPYHHGDRL